MSRTNIIIGIVIIILMFVGSTDISLAIEQQEIQQILETAENSLAETYMEIAEIGETGGDVGSLMVVMENSAILLADAFNVYRLGDYDEAYRLVTDLYQVMDGIGSEISNLKLQLEQTRQERLLLTTGLSSALLGILVVISLIGWRIIRKRHFRKVLKMKPEVTDANEIEGS
jgi:hypothetical protein